MNVGSPRSSRRAAGFTIVETMIVLAVTGALFVAIAATMSGRQNEAQFVHAIQSVQSQIQQTINQVAEGYYPHTADFTCVDNGTSLQILSGSTAQGTNAQGINNGCVFLGKAIQFGIAGTGAYGGGPEQYQVYTVAGLLGQTGGATIFHNASPTVVVQGTRYAQYSTAESLEYGLGTAWMTYNGSAIGGVAFLMEPGTASATSGNGFVSGAQSVDLIPITTVPGFTLNRSLAFGVNAFNTALQGNSLIVNPAQPVKICFASGGSRQSGLITIGGGTGRQLTVSLDIRSNRTCS